MGKKKKKKIFSGLFLFKIPTDSYKNYRNIFNINLSLSKMSTKFLRQLLWVWYRSAKFYNL